MTLAIRLEPLSEAKIPIGQSSFSLNAMTFLPKLVRVTGCFTSPQSLMSRSNAKSFTAPDLPLSIVLRVLGLALAN
jgi:hypothetical protein